MTRSTRPAVDRGAATIDFVLVSVPLLFLLLGIVQLGMYLHLRGIVVASAAEGARHGALRGATGADGGPFAERVLAAGTSRSVTEGVRCVARRRPGEGGLMMVEVRCRGALPTLIAGFGHLLPLDVRAHAVSESG